LPKNVDSKLLVTYGSDLIVLEPEDLRLSLARDAAQLLSNYGYPGIDVDTVADNFGHSKV
jgi:hypothetical protein